MRKEERNLIDLELMIMEQVQDWELDIGKVEAESDWDKVQDMVVTLPNDSTQTIRITAEPQKRSWFGLCPNSMKIGSLKMCGGCKMVGYFGKDDQKADWTEHKVFNSIIIFAVYRKSNDNPVLLQLVCKAFCSLTKKLGVKHICEKLTGDRLVDALSHELGRPLKQWEMDLCHYPRVCAISGETNQDLLKNCPRCHCVAWSVKHIEKGKEEHEQWCHLLKTALEDYKHEKTLGHQVQKYTPNIETKYSVLPASIEILFEKDVAKVVSNKLPGIDKDQCNFLIE